MDVLSWMGIFHPVVNENDFAVAFERHALFKFHDIILRHFTETINAIMKSWNRWSWWSREFGTPTMGEMSFWTKSYHITSVASNVTNPLIFWHVNVIWYVTMILTNTFERKYMALTLTRTFMIHFHWHRNEIVLWYYVMIYGYFFLMLFERTMWYKIIQNFNSLRCLVLEISPFKFGNHRGFRYGAGVHKPFMGGVWHYTMKNNRILQQSMGHHLSNSGRLG